MVYSHPFHLNAANGAQVLALPRAFHGAVGLALQFEQAPSAGSVTVETRRPGSLVWEPVQNATQASATPGRLTVYTAAPVVAVRVTFAGLVGGVRPWLDVVEGLTAFPPAGLITDGGFGASSRLRVDPGQTGFFAGKFFRSYLEANIPVAGPSVQFRFTSPVDFILWSQVVALTQGALELRIYGGATESGVWTARPAIGVNRMAQRPAPYYVPQASLSVGGNFTGGTELDVIKVRTASQNVNTSNINEQASERGLPAGSYYGRFSTLTGGLTVNDAAQLLYSLVWEERA